MTIKTLHITNSYHASSGGIRTTYQALLRAANRLGRPVRLVVPGERDSIEDVGDFGRIYSIRASRLPVGDRRYRTLLPTYWLRPRQHVLWSIVREENPDLIEVADKLCLPYLAGLLRKGWISGIRRPTLVGMSCERFDDTVAAYLSRHPLADWLASWYLGRVYIPQFDFHVPIHSTPHKSSRRRHCPRIGAPCLWFRWARIARYSIPTASLQNCDDVF